MKIAVDTNILLRALVDDDERQSPKAVALMRAAESIAITLPTFCELAWVLERTYRRSRSEIAEAIQKLIDSAVVVTDIEAVSVGIRTLLDGGDFADGVIAYEGGRLGAEQFATFDRKAAELISRQGFETILVDRR